MVCVVDVCAVCIAGAVMANTMGLDIERNWDPSNFPGPARDKLLLIEQIRIGRMADAVEFAREARLIGFTGLVSEGALRIETQLMIAWHQDMRDPTENYEDWDRAWRTFIKKVRELGL